MGKDSHASPSLQSYYSTSSVVDHENIISRPSLAIVSHPLWLADCINIRILSMYPLGVSTFYTHDANNALWNKSSM